MALASLAQSSYKTNVVPSLLLISTFLRLMLNSEAPRVAVLSSVAAEIPAPTRSLYAGNKAALSMFLRSLRIELECLALPGSLTKKIGITIVHSASIETGLRASALDAAIDGEGGGSTKSANNEVKQKAMTATYVAEQVVQAIDQEKDEVWLPKSYWWISKFAMVLVPNIVKQGAKRKYGFA